MSIQFNELANAAAFLAPDSGIEVAHVWDDGAQLWAVAGGQTGGWSIDRDVWVYDNLPGGPHADKDYSGFWAMNAPPPAIVATNLRVQNATLESTPRGWPLYRMPIDADRIITIWDGYDRSNGNKDAFAIWQIEYYDAVTGVLLLDSDRPVKFISLFAGESEGSNSLLIRVRAIGAPRGNYVWPPPSYAAVSGEPNAQPTRYSWIHPITGAVYFYDPRFGVGAKPYSVEYDDQRAILNEEAGLKASGQTRKIKEWVSLLIEFDAQGQQLRADGEWSVIRVVRGNAQWDENTALQCTAPALWRAPLDTATLQPTGPFEQWNIDASLRHVGALLIDVDGSLIIGGSCSGASGPVPALFQIQPDSDVAGDEARGELTVSLFYCECATPQGKSLRDVVRHRAGETDSHLRAVSPCDNFRHFSDRPIDLRLKESHPGGRNLLSWKNELGWHCVFSTEAADFASDPFGKHQLSNAFLLLLDSGGWKVGAPLGKQLDSQLAIYGGRVMGVEDETARAFLSVGIDTDNLGVQHLGASDNGEVWRHLASWDKSQFDGGVMARWGNKTDGNALWCLGTTAKPAMAPRALRLQGTQITRNIASSHFVQRANMFTHNGIERMIGVGLAYDSATGYSREQRIILSPVTASTARVCAFWDEPSQSFRMTRNTFTEAGGTLARLAPFYEWQAGKTSNGGGQWVAATTEPAYPFLEVETTEFLLIFKLSGVKPYSTNLFGLLCFDIGDDGNIDGPQVDTGCNDAVCVLDKMPPDTRVSVIRLDELKRPLAAVAIDVQLRSDEGIPAYLYESLYPAIWLRVDGAIPLSIESGQTLTGEQLATLSEFNLRARLDVDRFLPLEATTRVEAVVLLASDWAIDASELKPRF